jgi:co-chaperonin GroES (HSP10)
MKTETATCSIRPVGHKILVEPKEVETMSPGGIAIPVLNERLQKVAEQLGVLVAVGDTAWNAHVIRTQDGKEMPGKPWAKVGDKVWFSKFGGSFVEDPVTGKEYVLMNDDDINAVFEE